jgi:CTP:molybdopterin cytidylyltransferase MocA
MSPGADRRDWAVILARGDSRRMGAPKGLIALPDDPRPLLRRVAELHDDDGRPLCIVTTPALAAAYAGALPRRLRPVWALHPPGGDTAASVLAAVARLGARATHLWLHPVDVPHVDVATCRLLAGASRREPAAVVVPTHDGVRGHPVVLPCAPWRGREPADHDGPMRDLILAAGVPVLLLAVDDPGVARDHDEPPGTGDRGTDGGGAV